MTIPTWGLLALAFGSGAFLEAAAIILIAIWSDYLDQKAGKK